MDFSVGKKAPVHFFSSVFFNWAETAKIAFEKLYKFAIPTFQFSYNDTCGTYLFTLLCANVCITTFIQSVLKNRHLNVFMT